MAGAVGSSGAVRNRGGSAGPIAPREASPRLSAGRGRARGFKVLSRSYRAGTGRGPPSREPKWPPETPRDLEALCEAAPPPSPAGLPRGARPALCTRDPQFLQRQQALLLPGAALPWFCSPRGTPAASQQFCSFKRHHVVRGRVHRTAAQETCPDVGRSSIVFVVLKVLLRARCHVPSLY